MADEKEKKENEYDQTWEILNSPIFLLPLCTAILIGLYYLTSPYQDCVRLLQGPDYNKGLNGAREICLKWTNW